MPAPPGGAAPHYSPLLCIHVSPAAAPAATVSSLTHFTAAAQFQTSQPAMSTATTPAAEVRHGEAEPEPAAGSLGPEKDVVGSVSLLEIIHIPMGGWNVC